VLTSTSADEACKGVDVAVMVGGFPRKAGMERKDVMSKNVSIYAAQAAALEKHANKGVKVRAARGAALCVWVWVGGWGVGGAWGGGVHCVPVCLCGGLWWGWSVACACVT
jgi:hypothetical protein